MFVATVVVQSHPLLAKLEFAFFIPGNLCLV